MMKTISKFMAVFSKSKDTKSLSSDISQQRNGRKELSNIFVILLVGFTIRLFLANFGTLELDHGTFVSWGNSLALNGLKDFYSGWSDYLPGYLYVLWFLGKVNYIFPGFQTIIFKLPAIIADVATGYLIYLIIRRNYHLISKVKKINSTVAGQIGAVLYLINPAIFANSTLWGQVDSLTAFFSMLAIYIFPQSYFLSAIFMSIGTLIKPQAAFILPAILYLFLINKKKFTDMVIYAVTGLSVFFLGFAPFNNGSTNLFQFVLGRLDISSGQYPYGSVNAFSFWAYFGFWRPDNNIFWIGLLICIVILLFSFILIFIKKPKGGEYLLAAISLLVTFLFLTRIHERHLLPVLAPILVASFFNPLIYITYFLISGTYILNLAYSFQWITNDFKEIFNLTFVRLFITLNISGLLVLFVSLFKNLELKIKSLNFKLDSKNLFGSKDISDKLASRMLVIILLFSLGTRLYSLGTIKEMYFDEIYHSYTAKLVLHGDPKAWEWWNPNPDGYAYEWTHPPLSKLGMVVGMKIFGENSFGWRFPQAILGTLSVLVVYLLGKTIFRDKYIGILSAAIFSLDGLPLVLSRMGMNDSYVLFFSLLSVLLFIKDKNLLSSIAFGLALASKWSGVYTFPIIFISHFVFRKKISVGYLSFFVIPVAVYILSYSVMFATGHSWANFVEVQKQMWWYHTSLVATHPYTSPAWTWPLLIRPVYLYDGQIIDDLVSRIYLFGNPIIFWFGATSVVVSSWFSITERKIAYERSKKIGFIVFSYLIFFLPWIMSPRIMFLYHYLPSIPFLAISSGFILRRFPKIATYYILIATIVFVYFYPHYTGIRIPEWLDTSYYWLSSWR